LVNKAEKLKYNLRIPPVNNVDSSLKRATHKAFFSLLKEVPKGWRVFYNF
jgi:hypothetical protein